MLGTPLISGEEATGGAAERAGFTGTSGVEATGTVGCIAGGVGPAGISGIGLFWVSGIGLVGGVIGAGAVVASGA